MTKNRIFTFAFWSLYFSCMFAMGAAIVYIALKLGWV
jgi:hypothetical protein